MSRIPDELIEMSLDNNISGWNLGLNWKRF